MSSEDRRRHDRDRLATALRARREGLGLSRRDVADRSGLSYPYVSQLENGDREPSLDALGRLASALDATTEELLTTPVQRTERLLASRPAPAAPMRSGRVVATEDAVGASAGASARASAGASWHANPSFTTARGRSASSPSGVDAAVDEAYAALRRLAPTERLDAAGILLARCVRDATPSE